ncbi:MAG TPA: peptidase M49 [Isosphaeraceae bacterium]|jgi:dipeptidyl-peptidase-3
MRLRLIGSSPLIVLVLVAAARPDEPTPQRKYLLERVDDAAVVQLYADGFERLPLRQKLLAWHLYQAALAGRDIYYDQRYAHALKMRAVLEEILTHADHVNPATLAEIRRYTKLFWLNSGPYNNLTARKFVLKCKQVEFLRALEAAAGDGARFPIDVGNETADAFVDKLLPPFFDPDVDPIVTNKSPGPGKDLLASSANNLYVGVTMDDLKGFAERYPLNSRLVNLAGQLTEEVYRVGGRYDEQIRRIVAHLEDAIAVAPEPTAEALRALVRFYRTGETADREAYDIAWVRDKDAPVDTINGFIEVYLDPRGVKGSWEAAVFSVNPEKTAAIQAVAAQAQWFEDHMPWEAKYRKPDVRGITANAIEVIVETGDCGPITPIGINLPNDQAIRERHGSKSVSLSNVIEANDKATPPAFRREFAWDDAEAQRAERWNTLAGELLVDMHEVIGHASGRVAPELKGQPQDALREFYSALEEGRADLVALYYMPDPKLAELGLVAAEDQAEMARAAYEAYTRNALSQLRRVRQGDQLEEDHMRNRQMVVHWLMANTRAIESRHRDGKTYYVMVDPGAFRAGVGRLLAEIQRIKSEGDFAAAKALFEAHGIRFDPALRDEVVARVAGLDMPSYTGFVMPRLRPVTDPQGRITDVTISYPQDLESQMLEFSEFGRH